MTVRWAAHPADIADADVVVIPGTKATVADLAWMRRHGVADAVVAHARSGGPVLGICGGFQMLATTIDDRVESGAGVVEGWACSISTSPSSRLRRCGAGDLRGSPATKSTTARLPARRCRPG